MSRKETDLQKAITEITSAMQDKDLDNLKEQLFANLDSPNDLNALLQNPSLIQSLMKNKNIAKMMKNPDITNQLNDILKSNDSNDIVNQVQNMLSSDKKKNEIENVIESNARTYFDQELKRLKDSIFSKFETETYKNEIALFEAMQPFVNQSNKQYLKQLIEYYRYKGIFETLNQN